MSEAANKRANLQMAIDEVCRHSQDMEHELAQQCADNRRLTEVYQENQDIFLARVESLMNGFTEANMRMFVKAENKADERLERLGIKDLAIGYFRGTVKRFSNVTMPRLKERRAND